MIPATVSAPTGGTSELGAFLAVIVFALAFVGFIVVGVVRDWHERRRGPRRSSRRPSNRKSSGQRRGTPPSTGTGTGTGRTR
jgi:hypothetical protein